MSRRRNADDLAQDAFAGQGSRGEQIAGGRMDGMRSRVVQGDPGVPSAASGPRATDGSEGFPVTTNPPRKWDEVSPEQFTAYLATLTAKGIRVAWDRGTTDEPGERSESAYTADSVPRQWLAMKFTKGDRRRYFVPGTGRSRVTRRNDDGGTSHAGATRSDVRSPTRTRTEVRSPTSTSTEVRSPTSTSTQAHTSGNVTVTGGAGAGAETHVTLVRPNPHLMLVTGNPPKAEILEAWCRFHQRDEFDGAWETIPDIRGVPKAMFALGRCAEIDVGEGLQELVGGKVYLACDPSDESLWMVARAAMNLNGAQGADVKAIVYEPPDGSGKDPALYRHAFSKPRPKLSPVGHAFKCRAALLEGGVYEVSDWIRE